MIKRTWKGATYDDPDLPSLIPEERQPQKRGFLTKIVTHKNTYGSSSDVDLCLCGRRKVLQVMFAKKNYEK